MSESAEVLEPGVGGSNDKTDFVRAAEVVKLYYAFGAFPTAKQNEEILALAIPFHSLKVLQGSKSEAASQSLLGFIWAATGDAKYYLHRPRLAVEAYCKAVEFFPNHWVADPLARLVLKYSIEEKYEIAIRALESGERAWRAVPMHRRLYFSLASFLRSPRGFIQFTIPNSLMRKKRYRELAKKLNMCRNRNSILKPEL